MNKRTLTVTINEDQGTALFRLESDSGREPYCMRIAVDDEADGYVLTDAAGMDAEHHQGFRTAVRSALISMQDTIDEALDPRNFCTDERHGTSCSLPCEACAMECAEAEQ